MNMTERLERLDKMIANDLLIRGRWHDLDTEGRERASLLAALSPEAGSRGDATACPADVMPTWFACLTPWIGDACTLEMWPDVTRRYAAAAHRWGALTDLDWAKLQRRVRGICIREAVQHTTRTTYNVYACDYAHDNVLAAARAAATCAYIAVIMAVADAVRAAAAAYAAKQKASDRMIGQILTAIEESCLLSIS
jgi:hypothetical protein